MIAYLSTRLRPAKWAVITIMLFTMVASLSVRTSDASAAAGHSYAHGSLVCSATHMDVGRGMFASVRPGESVRLFHTLYRWNGARWVAQDTSGPIRTYPTSQERVTAEYSRWYRFNGVFAPKAQFPGWFIYQRGHYAIDESITWFDSAGNVTGQHTGSVTTTSGGHYYCSY